VLALLAFAAHIPVSPQPEKAYLNLLRRFFGSCGYLVSASRRESHGASRWLKRRREAYHLQQVALLPQKLAGWSRSVDSRLCPGSTAPQLQSVSAAVEVLGYRMHEILDARATPHSAAIARAVQSEIHAWRTGLREVFQCLAKEPETADQASFRARLDARLDSLEAHMERAIDRADATAISEAEAENGYRLLGAHRGISDALIDFSRRAAAIDWPCLRAARF
jgi:hypothetical protein